MVYNNQVCISSAGEGFQHFLAVHSNSTIGFKASFTVATEGTEIESESELESEESSDFAKYEAEFNV